MPRILPVYVYNSPFVFHGKINRLNSCLAKNVSTIYPFCLKIPSITKTYTNIIKFSDFRMNRTITINDNQRFFY